METQKLKKMQERWEARKHKKWPKQGPERDKAVLQGLGTCAVLRRSKKMIVMKKVAIINPKTGCKYKQTQIIVQQIICATHL